MDKPRSIAIVMISCALSLTGGPPHLGHAQPVAERLQANPPGSAILGEWWTEGKDGRIRFVRAEDGTYQGVLVWGNNPGKDVNNKDPKRRNLSVIGMVLMWHLRYDDGEYVDGYVYNPRDGDTYRMKAELKGANALKIRGYLGIQLFGQSQMWARAE
jgi:uncharacterized protein (DUF2147 family)